MEKISKSQFKPRALEVMRNVEKTGQAIIITDHGTRTLELRPYVPDRVKQDPLAYLKRTVLNYIDPLEPVAEHDRDSTA